MSSRPRQWWSELYGKVCLLVCVYVDRGTRWIDETSPKHRALPETGLLTVFPSYLSHYQQLYTGQKDRVMVGFNTIGASRITKYTRGKK